MTIGEVHYIFKQNEFESLKQTNIATIKYVIYFNLHGIHTQSKIC